MRILAIDPGTVTGFAFSDGRAGSVSFAPTKAKKRPPTPAEPAAARCGKLLRWLEDGHYEPGHEDAWGAGIVFPNVVVCEGAAAFQRGKAAVRVSHELRGVVQGWCHWRGVEYVEIQPGDLKRFATGRFNADKSDMLAHAVAKGIPGLAALDGNERDDNVIDALWTLAWARQHLVVEPTVEAKARAVRVAGKGGEA